MISASSSSSIEADAVIGTAQNTENSINSESRKLTLFLSVVFIK